MPTENRGPRSLPAYIAAVGFVALVLWALAGIIGGWPEDWWTVLALTGLCVAALGMTAFLDSDVNLSATSIILLAAIVLLPPAGAGLVGGAAFFCTPNRNTVQRRAFNAAMFTIAPVLGAFTYHALGGRRDIDGLKIGELILYVGIPLAIADVVQLVANALLLCGVLRMVERQPFRVLLLRLLRGTGLTYFAQGVLAFLLVLMWQPGGLGLASVVLLVPPIVAAAWAYRQFAEERTSHERGLEVLVASLEMRAPHLQGHSARVAHLSGAIAGELGMSPPEIRDIRQAGMLHDLGQVALPYPVLTSMGADRPPEFETYPQRGVEMMSGLSFLGGALDIVAQHRDPLPGPAARGVTGAQIVHVADRYDLLTGVDGLDGRRLRAEEAIAVLETGADDQVLVVLEALRQVRARVVGDGADAASGVVS